MKALRKDYIDEIKGIAKENIVFVDETGSACNLSPTFGRSPINEPVYDQKPTSRGKRISTIGALSIDKIETAFCFEGTLNGVLFLYFLENFLCPILKPGMCVVLDNATAHKVDGVRELIEGKGAKIIYLPPYTPEFNAIEFAWAKIKKFVRRQKARTTDALYESLSQALTTITSSDASNFTMHALNNAT